MTHRPDESKFYTLDKSKADHLESEMGRLAEAATYTEWKRRNPAPETAAPEPHPDTVRLNFLEHLAKQSSTGVNLSYTRTAEGELTETGFHLQWRRMVSRPYDLSARRVVDEAMAYTGFTAHEASKPVQAEAPMSLIIEALEHSRPKQERYPEARARHEAALNAARELAAHSPASGAVERDITDAMILAAWKAQLPSRVRPIEAHEAAEVKAMLRAALAAQPLEKHPDSLRCIEARNKLNAAMYGEGVLIDDLEHAVASACVKLATQPLEQKPVEPLTRFCPGCGSVGPVDAKYRDCCPDGSDARMIPEKLAAKCRNLFKLALEGIAQPEQVAQDGGPADCPNCDSNRFCTKRACNELELVECPDCKGSAVPGFRRGAPCSTCDCTGQVRAARASGQEGGE